MLSTSIRRQAQTSSKMAPRIILYSADVCPFAHRARIALAASGAEYETVEIDLQNKPEWYPKVNPASKVPAIWYDAPKDADPSKPSKEAFILPESGLIVNFLADVFPQIADKDPLQKARAAFVASQYEPVFGAWFAYVRSDGGKDQKEFGDFIQALKDFTEKYLPDEYVESKGFNTADILMGPMITQMNIWIEKNIADWPNKSAGPDLKEALKAPELEKFMKYHDKLANWSALTSTRKDTSFKGASAKVKSMRESKH
ncbi:hypothetical protein FFLO_03584 [Filobasidium floriforme]|uniref:GST N-terminal domain-containing protein n=1 Tax=Filobasidium floriforme TaxID=5210 RepID=A0A8K0NT01_9TREE|nr:hypothetical protein FFLO_03584 [Filobasidium floriforme]